jgi:pyruvate ferredoxin oxidoreductase gamma subunit/2-oxoisovalerate ferredoxin oxidoreductase gamma subunit
MVQDPSLLDFVDVTKGLRPGGMVLINQPQPKAIPDRFSGFRVMYLNANRIALNNGLGTRTHPIINTAMVGGFARLLKELSLENVVASISEEVPSNHEANIKAARQAYDTVLESSNISGDLPAPSPGFPQGKQQGVCSRLRLQCLA